MTVTSIIGYKQHKHNPSQVSIAMPFALFSSGLLLMFSNLI